MALTRADYKELRHAHDAWLSGVLFDLAWNTMIVLDDVMLQVAGGGPGRTDRLTSIKIDTTGAVRSSASTPVVWDGVDLFGHPAPDVVSVLPQPTRPSSPTAADVTVEPLGLWLRDRLPAENQWSHLDLLSTPTGWEQCCAGTFACGEGGDGFVGILR
ncbi:hypothetical protein [Streptomyces sp. NPDC014734]|uniref:hypothetical protein n=1 Tax=Streptomyces sp. NPDC014734 TaxID=3364886 RepID=UPI0036FE37AA